VEEKKIRIFIVDDSAFMRMVLKDVLEKEKDMQIVGIAKDGMEAIELAIKTKPDIITLDVEMPKLNGIEALKEIMKRAPTRVIMVSSLTEEGADITITALELGAVDFITKPAGSISMNFRKIAGDLIQKIRAAMQVDVKSLVRKATYTSKKLNLKSLVSSKIVVIGSSTGGPKSLDLVIPPLPENYPAPIIIVQHMPAGFTKSLAQRLNKISNLYVKEAEEGDVLEPGKVYIAPGDYHLGIKQHDKKSVVYLEKSEKINNVRPAVDFTLDKVAEIYKDKTIAVILTGMGKDGTKGAFKVKYYKGIVIAESKETCVVYGMPKSVVEEGYADFELPAYKIPEKLVEIV
jgi:two-component system chemotaxis response regulator CheB